MGVLLYFNCYDHLWGFYCTLTVTIIYGSFYCTLTVAIIWGGGGGGVIVL